jgi:cell division protein FtsW
MLFVAAKLAPDKFRNRSQAKRMTEALAATGVYLALIVLEPDLGTAIVLFLAFLTMFLAGGARAKQIAIIVSVAALLFVIKGGLKPGQMSRLRVFTQQGMVEAGDGYQSFHSRLAIGSGEYTGMGWGSGREKYYLPQANSDYIFATVGEEFGLIGTSIVLLMFAVITWCGITIARQAADPFGRLLAVGLTAIISWQALINIAVVTVSIPATGVPLPFISNGLTSLILTLVSVGLLINIAQESKGVRIEAEVQSSY